MTTYRLWQVRRGDKLSGPFPEPYVCEQILLGRIREDDQLSLDGHSWRGYLEVPEIAAEITRLLDPETEDPQWREERIRAALRNVDERKRVDRRASESPKHAALWQERRRQQDRRRTPETVQQHVYRQQVTDVDNWLRHYRQRYRWAALAFVAAVVGLGAALHAFQAVNPIDIGLRVSKTCDRPAARGVDWHGCDKSGYLLAGADLRQANLAGINFAGANLSYAHLEGADIKGALLQGAKLDGAVWPDGRVCGIGSLGQCR